MEAANAQNDAAWARSKQGFEQAAAWFVDSAARVGNLWECAGLGNWTMRGLGGHIQRALLTVEAYLDQPAATAELATANDYFRRAMSASSPAEIAERGRLAGAALGDQPAQALAAVATRAINRVRAASAEDLISTPFGGMCIASYLPTRTFELTVHTCDMLAALEEKPRPPLAALSECWTVLGCLAADRADSGDLLLALTGRRSLTTGFSLLRPPPPEAGTR